MLFKKAYVYGVQRRLVEAGVLKYANEEVADAQAGQLADQMAVEPAEGALHPQQVAEIANALLELSEQAQQLSETAEAAAGVAAPAAPAAPVAEAAHEAKESPVEEAAEEKKEEPKIASVFKRAAEDASATVGGTKNTDGDKKKDDGTLGKTSLPAAKMTGNELGNPSPATGVVATGGDKAPDTNSGTKNTDGNAKKDDGALGKTSLPAAKQQGNEVKQASVILERIKQLNLSR